ncbi:MAG: glycosyltransferase family 2 protein [Cyanobacteria bacterium P01_D01_bin.73]
MLSSPSFTVVITTYNRLPLLKRAVESAIAQTVPCEIVIVDDQSTDGTDTYGESLAITHRDPDHPIIYHRQPQNQGHSAAVNAGVALAKGDWIKPLDDDDYLAEDCIAQLAIAIQHHRDRFHNTTRPPVVICSSQAAQVNQSGVELSRTQRTGPGHAYFIPQEDIHYGMLMEVVPFGTPAQVAFQRQAFLDSGGWDSNFDTNCDDIDAWLRIAQHGDAIFINACLAYRTLWEGAWNQKFPLQQRFDTNWLIKQKIHRLVPVLHQKQIPKTQALKAYLRLHWGLVALKQMKPIKAWLISRSALGSWDGWWLLLKARFSRRFARSLARRHQEPNQGPPASEPEFSMEQLPQRIAPESEIKWSPLRIRWMQLRLRLRLSRVIARERKWGLAFRLLGTSFFSWGLGTLYTVLRRIGRYRLIRAAIAPPYRLLRRCYRQINPQPVPLSANTASPITAPATPQRRRILLCDRPLTFTLPVQQRRNAPPKLAPESQSPAPRSNDPFTQWLRRDLVITNRLYTFLSPNQRQKIPSLQDVRAYIRLRWLGRALREGKLMTAAKVGLPVLLRWGGWRLLMGDRWQLRNVHPPQVRKFILMETPNPESPSPRSAEPPQPPQQ